MFSIRKGCFETNSSSMHSLAIWKKCKPYSDYDLSLGTKYDRDKEAYQREFKPKSIPSYEDFKAEYKEDQLMWLDRFEDDLRSAKSSLKKCKEYNKTIKQIFMWLDQVDRLSLKK